MKVYVVGAGAVGRYLGETLRAIGNDVAYAPRDPAAVAPVDADLAIVAVKAYDTGGAIETLRRALGEGAGTTIVTPQNGVGNEEQLAAAFGADAIVACALTVPVETDASGAVRAARGGGIAFAPVGSGRSHNWLLAAFGATGLPVRSFADYRALKWSKLALNIVANAGCAILDELPEQLVRSPAFDVDIRAIREAAAVMRAQGIAAVDLPRYPVRALLRAAALPLPLARALLAGRIAGARGRKPPSLLLDLRAGKAQTEVDVLSGAVAAAARRTGTAAPVNAAYARLVTEIAREPARWAEFRGRPEALVAAVAAEPA